MTRINLVSPKELCNKHLFAEIREMPRLVGNLQKSLNRKKTFSLNEIPSQYVLGRGHVKFFYNKFKFLHKRHQRLIQEALSRGFKLTQTDSDIFTKVDGCWFQDYNPSQSEININRSRIKDRLPKNPNYGQTKR